MKSLAFLITALSLFSPLLADDWQKSKTYVFEHLNELEGWCLPNKANEMMNLIYSTHPKICVEIGVFGGASIFPTASALKFNKKGVVYAVDPWSNEECLKGYPTNDPHYIWWSQIDLHGILNSFRAMLEKHRLNEFCHIMRMTSAQAVLLFEDHSIDIIHIDGNHSENSALLDVELFLPKLKPGAYIWFDDANWESTHKAIAFLLEHCDLDPSISADSPFLLFKKR